MKRRALLLLSLSLLSAAPATAEDCRAPAPASVYPGATPALPPGTRIGLALGSGSTHGHAHIGVLQELEARKFPVHVVAGTSVGALVGALWASGVSARAIDDLARREDLGGLGRLAGSWQGILSSDGMRAPLEKAFHGRPIEAWPRRFGAVATNLANGERRVIASGDGATAVRASSAVPVLYRPIEVRGELLVDGALVEPVPVDAARDLGANFVIGVDVAYRPDEEEARGINQYAFQAMHILVNSLAAQQLRSADVAIRLNLHKRWTRCGRDALVEAGRDAVRRAWPEVLRALALRAQRVKRQ